MAEMNSTSLVYFGDVSRVLPRMLREELGGLLPKHAVLCVDFIGASVLEVLTTESTKTLLIATMECMRYKHLPSFDLLGSHVHARRAPTEGHYGNIDARMCLKRVQRILNRFCKGTCAVQLGGEEWMENTLTARKNFSGASRIINYRLAYFKDVLPRGR